jgi:hypothetical protein
VSSGCTVEEATKGIDHGASNVALGLLRDEIAGFVREAPASLER